MIKTQIENFYVAKETVVGTVDNKEFGPINWKENLSTQYSLDVENNKRFNITRVFHWRSKILTLNIPAAKQKAFVLW